MQPTDAPTATPTASPTYPNLVLNADFEDETNALANWYSYGSGTLVVDDTEKYSGSHSALATDRGRSYTGPAQDLTSRVEANKTYKLSCWAKLKGDTSSSTFKLTFKVGDSGRESARYMSVYGIANNSSWSLVQGERTIDIIGTLTSLKIYAEGPAAGVEFWVDKFSVVLVP